MNIEEVEEPESTRITTKNPRPTTAATPKVREFLRKMNLEEVEEPETTRITTKNPRPTTAATRKVRELPRKMNIEEVRHLRSNTPAFFYYRKNPRC